MNNVGKLLLKCIDCYVNNKKLNIEIDFDESSWYEFYLLSQNQSLLPISYEMISSPTLTRRTQEKKATCCS